MPGVKTAISIDNELFKKVNKIAQDLQVSRSRVFTLAVLDFIKKQENISLLAQLNEAYQEQPTEEEENIIKSMRKSRRQMSEQEPW